MLLYNARNLERLIRSARELSYTQGVIKGLMLAKESLDVANKGSPIKCKELDKMENVLYNYTNKYSQMKSNCELEFSRACDILEEEG